MSGFVLKRFEVEGLNCSFTDIPIAPVGGQKQPLSDVLCQISRKDSRFRFELIKGKEQPPKLARLIWNESAWANLCTSHHFAQHPDRSDEQGRGASAASNSNGSNSNGSRPNRSGLNGTAFGGAALNGTGSATSAGSSLSPKSHLENGQSKTNGYPVPFENGHRQIEIRDDSNAGTGNQNGNSDATVRTFRLDSVNRQPGPSRTRNQTATHASSSSGFSRPSSPATESEWGKLGRFYELESTENKHTRTEFRYTIADQFGQTVEANVDSVRPIFSSNGPLVENGFSVRIDLVAISLPQCGHAPLLARLARRDVSWISDSNLIIDLDL